MTTGAWFANRGRRFGSPRVFVPACVAVLLLTGAALAGGPHAVNGLGQPMKWSVAAPIPYNPDQGMLGQLSNTAAREETAAAFQVWANAGFVSFSQASALPYDINADGAPGSNPAHWKNFWRVSGDGYSPVIFDVDGSIIDQLYGQGARFDIVGLAALDTPVGVATQITEASIIINGAFFDGVGLPASPEDLSGPGFRAVIVHEIGHFLNLDHSALNHQLAQDGDPSNDRYLPTMYPLLSDDPEAAVTLNPDDQVALQNLYDSATPGSGVSGRALSGGLPFQGAQVTVRRIDDPLFQAYSVFSGEKYYPCNPGSTCDPCHTPCDPGHPDAEGAYDLYFTAPGVYRVCIRQVDTLFSTANSVSVGPLADAAVLSGPDECYSVVESADPAADDPDDIAELDLGAVHTGVDIILNDLPATDPFEPNNNLGSAATLADLPSGRDTAPAVLPPGDLDFYAVPVSGGQHISIDVDAGDFDSSLDAVVGVYDSSNALMAVADDGVDPDTGAFSFDPVLEFVAGFTGTAKVVVSSFGDDDFDGVGGATAGPYWIRVEVDPDSDSDGVVDRLDVCPLDPGDDADEDGNCADSDNCPPIFNPTQWDSDDDGVGDPCDNCLGFTVHYDFQQGPEGWSHASRGAADTWHTAAATCAGDALPSAMFVSNGNRGPGCADDSSRELSQLLSPTIALPPGVGLRLSFVALSYDQAGNCIAGGLKDSHDVGLTTDGGSTYTLLNDCYAIASGGGIASRRDFDITPWAGQTVQVIFVYDTIDAMTGHTFAVDDVAIVQLGMFNPDQSDADEDGTGDVCDGCPLDAGWDADGDGICGNVDNCPTLANPAQDGGPRVKANGPLVTGGDVTENLEFSPDSRRGVYIADQEIDEKFELYSVFLPDGTPTKLNPALTSGDVVSFAISPDSSRVVHLTNDGGEDYLYSVAITGGTNVRLDVPSLCALPDFGVSPNSARVVYRAHDCVRLYSLYSVPIGGGASTLLSTHTGSGLRVTSQFIVTPDSAAVVFLAKDMDENRDHIYKAPIDGSASPTRLDDASGTEVILTPLTLSPDGAWVVYAKDRSAGYGAYELFSVPFAGGANTKLSGTLSPGGSVIGPIWISQDSQRVVYMADENHDYVQDIHSVPIGGGANIKLNDGLGSADFGQTSPISADSTRVVFSTAGNKLYSRPIGGGGATLLDTLTSLRNYGITPNGARVVYGSSTGVLRSAPISGGAFTQYTGNWDSSLYWFALTPDSSTVIYGDTGSPPHRLVSSPIAGGPQTDLSGPLVSGGHLTPTFASTNDSGRVGYLADQDTDEVFELYTRALMADPDGDGKLSACDNCPAVGNPGQADDDNDGFGNLCDNCAADFNPDQFNPDGDAPGSACDNCPAHFNPDQADGDADGTGEACDPCPGDPRNDEDGDGLCTADDNCGTHYNPAQDNGEPVELSILEPEEGDATDIYMTPDGARVIYRADQQTNEVFEWWSVPVQGGAATRLNPPLTAGADVDPFLQIAPDSSLAAIMISGQDQPGVIEMWTVPVTGGPAVKINGMLVSGGNVDGERFSLDSRTVLYIADQDTDGVWELYAAPATGGRKTKINGPLGATGSVTQFYWSHDGSRVVYQAHQYSGGPEEIYSAPITGGSFIKLSGALPSGASVSTLRVSLSTPWAVYSADQDALGVVELYSVPTTGGRPRKLNGPLVSGGNVAGNFAISADGARVVYRADQDVDGTLELYSVPIQGGARVKLNGPLTAAGNVLSFAISRNSATVVYRADEDANEVYELYSVPIAGGVATKLNGPLVTGGDVTTTFRISNDSARVVYLADQQTDGVVELYSVPIGGGTPVKLNGALVAGGNVDTGIRIGDDNQTVLYRADQFVDEQFELFAAPILGGAARRLNSPLPTGGDVMLDSYAMYMGSVAINAGSSAVIYMADQWADERVEVYSVPLVADADSDGDLDFCDLCPDTPDPSQADADADGRGDACDNCPFVSNSSQQDSDGDGTGDACTVDLARPSVSSVWPADGSVDVALASQVVLVMNEPVDSDTATGQSIILVRGGYKAPGTIAVSADGMMITFDPDQALAPDADYVFTVNDRLRDLAGNPAIPCTSGFQTIPNPTSGTLPADSIGDHSSEEVSGAALGGAAASQSFGFSVASLGDVNADGTADLIVGSPDADDGFSNAGKVTLVLGEKGLQSNSGGSRRIEYVGPAEAWFVGRSLGRAGDLNDDGVADFVAGAPLADANGADSGVVYVVFGAAGLDEIAPTTLQLSNLASCASSTLCGVVFRGAVAADEAGAAVAFAGDIDNDGRDDLLIGAPGASPNSRAGAGKVYLVYGPLTPGTIELSAVGSTVRGLVFYGETAGDAAGEAVSWWQDQLSDGVDDLLIGAPNADPIDEYGDPIPDAGYVYAIHGGNANLDDSATPGVIELSRVANGLADEVEGVVFLGVNEGGKLGRSLTGGVDLDGDGEDDIAIGANGEVWIVPGDDPKGVSGVSPAIKPPGTGTIGPSGLSRQISGDSASSEFGAWLYDGAGLGELSVAPAGDVNADGTDDLVIGAPEADIAGKVDAGKAFIVFGGPAASGSTLPLEEVGVTIAGFTIEGFEAGDRLGSAVGGGFDLNGDGVADALVGAPLADSATSTPENAGESYVVSPLAPGAVQNLSVTGSGGAAALEWDACDRALAYDIYRGLVSAILAAQVVRTSAMTQIACGVFGDADIDGRPDATDPAGPPTGDALAYLVTGANLIGEGPLGPSAGAPPRVFDAQCP